MAYALLEDLPLPPSIWLHYIPIPVLVLLVLFPGIAFQAAWVGGKLQDAQLRLRWPWWRPPPDVSHKGGADGDSNLQPPGRSG